jgi:hypothetical protein
MDRECIVVPGVFVRERLLPEFPKRVTLAPLAKGLSRQPQYDSSNYGAKALAFPRRTLSKETPCVKYQLG